MQDDVDERRVGQPVVGPGRVGARQDVGDGPAPVGLRVDLRDALAARPELDEIAGAVGAGAKWRKRLRTGDLKGRVGAGGCQTPGLRSKHRECRVRFNTKSMLEEPIGMESSQTELDSPLTVQVKAWTLYEPGELKPWTM